MSPIFGMPNIGLPMVVLLFAAVILFMLFVPWQMQTVIVLAGLVYILLTITRR